MSEAKIDEKFLIENYHKMTVTALAEYFGVTRGTIQRRAKKYGLEKEETFFLLKGEQVASLDGPLSRYLITNLGRAVNTESGKVLKHKINDDGYPIYTFQVNKKKYYRLVHRLVAEKFIDNPFNKPHVNHIDGDKTNYSIDNLEWCTPKENAVHASKTGLLAVGEESGLNKITEEQARLIKRLADEGMRTCDIVREYNFASRSIVQKIRYGTRWKHIS